MISLSCGQCGHSITLDPGARTPAWCPRCGTDFKPKQDAPAASPPPTPVDASRSRPPRLEPPLPGPSSLQPPLPAPAAPVQPPPRPAGPRVLGVSLWPSREQWPLLIALLITVPVVAVGSR